jgi:hypothetical protein
MFVASARAGTMTARFGAMSADGGGRAGGQEKGAPIEGPGNQPRHDGPPSVAQDKLGPAL